MSLPEHLSAAQLAALLHKNESEIQGQIDRGSIQFESTGIPKSEAEAMLAVEAMRAEEFEYLEGKGSTNLKLPTHRYQQCDLVGSVHYVGTDVLEGSLEWVHVEHTEDIE